MQSNDIINDLHQHRKELLSQLRESVIEDIFGVVDASGSGGFRLQGEDHWTLLFSFDAWRFKGKNLRHEKLTFRKLTTEEELEEMKELINPFDVLHVRAGIVKNSISSGVQGLLDKFVGRIESDQELNEHADELRKPVTFTDSSLGLFVLDRNLNWYQSETIWKSEIIRLNLSMDNCKDEKGVLDIAHSLWIKQESWSQRIYDYVVENLLDLKNGPWLYEGGDMVTPDIFKSNMEIETITVYPDSSFEFWYNYSDQFMGHPIIVYGNLYEGPIDFEIPCYRLGQSQPSQESGNAVLL